jgi:hypothetical protein
LVLWDTLPIIIIKLGTRLTKKAGICLTNMTKREQEQRVLQELQYMIAEGMVVETSPGYYRLKTERELEQEMQALYNE